LLEEKTFFHSTYTTFPLNTAIPAILMDAADFSRIYANVYQTIPLNVTETILFGSLRNVSHPSQFLPSHRDGHEHKKSCFRRE
jgi:hypothetical protein